MPVMFVLMQIQNTEPFLYDFIPVALKVQEGTYIHTFLTPIKAMTTLRLTDVKLGP